MKYGNFIRKKSCIGVCAPSLSSPANPYRIRYDEAKKRFNKMNISIQETSSVYNEFIRARSADKITRAKEFESLWFDDNVNFIFSIAGGEFMMEILPYIDFEKIKESKPKFFMGYSDNTNLAFLLTTICDISSIYGYHIGDFGCKKLDASLKQALSLIQGKKLSLSSLKKYQIEDLKHKDGFELSSFNCTEKVIWKTLSKKDETIKGRIIGGCLDILIMLCGTKFDHVKEFIEKYKNDGIIWYLESCDLNILAQGRAFWQLEQAGWFKYCKGIVLGRPLNKADGFGNTYEEVLEDFLTHLNIPVIYDADIGHLPPSIPIINGSIATIECKKGKGKITYELK